MSDKPCVTPYCPKPARASRGLCHTHYHAARQAEKGIALRKDLWDTDIVPSTPHNRCKRLWGSASQYLCIECGGKASDWAYDGTDPAQLYGQERNGRNQWVFFSRFPEFYMPMCKRCHNGRDGRKARAELHEYRLYKHAKQQALLVAKAA